MTPNVVGQGQISAPKNAVVNRETDDCGIKNTVIAPNLLRMIEMDSEVREGHTKDLRLHAEQLYGAP